MQTTDLGQIMQQNVAIQCHCVEGKLHRRGLSITHFIRARFICGWNQSFLQPNSTYQDNSPRDNCPLDNSPLPIPPGTIAPRDNSPPPPPPEKITPWTTTSQGQIAPQTIALHDYSPLDNSPDNCPLPISPPPPDNSPPPPRHPPPSRSSKFRPL